MTLNVFATQSGPIPLSQLDANFTSVSAATGISFTPSGTGALPTTVQYYLQNFTVDSITALKAVTKGQSMRVFVTGYYTSGDGGGGEYWYDSTDTTSTDNAGTIIVATDGGRWKLAWQGEITVKQFGAKGDGTTDDTSSIQNTITTLGANVKIKFPRGTYKVTGNILIINDRVQLVGDGMYATEILFSPTANGECITFKKSPGAPIYQCSVREMAFFSNDSTYTKTALALYDISTMLIENISIGGSIVFGGGGYWRESVGSSSIGIRTHGREATNFRNIICYADNPIVVSPLLSAGIQISADHFNWHDLYLSATNKPIITIESGCVITQQSFTGYQAWVGGTGGVYWVDATNPGASNGLSFDNVRYENAVDATQYFININTVSGVQGLTVRAGQAGATKGLFLRNITNVHFDNFFYTDNSREALNVNSTVYPILCTSSYWQTGSTATITGLVAIEKKPNAITMPVAGDGLYTVSSTISYNWEIAGTYGELTVNLASGGTMSIGSANQRGFIMITTQSDVSAMFAVTGGTNSVAKVDDPFGFFTTTFNNAGTFNVYWSAGNSRYELQNSTAISRNIKIVRFGTGQGF